MGNASNVQLHKMSIYQRRYLKFDFIASVVVFLVAIPLCLGIAMASGAPLFSGIISGIIGGIVIGCLSGSHVSVSGPAAGMAAVVLTAITNLGSFDTFLLALVFAGILQFIIGTLRAGFIAEYVPSNVVQGLLCAIGILLIIKQLPLAFTLSANLTELKSHLLETTEGFSLKPLYELTFHVNTGAMVISLVSFAILIYFNKTKIKWLQMIPGPIVVVIAGIIMNDLFIFNDSYLIQSTPQLVNVPKSHSIGDFISQLTLPNWTAWSNPMVYFYAVVLALVASLETLLNIKAGEKLDKRHRYCSKNQELIAQGVGNFMAGLAGGLPITSVIVRTSVNIQVGAKTKASTIFHGILILMAVMWLPQMLNKIPLASLAVILIYTGYKLTKPSIYVGIFNQGMDRFIPFIATLVVIVLTDLLAGILVGLVVSLFFILKSNSKARLNIIKENYPNGTTNRLILPQQTTFLNKATLIEELNTIPRQSQLIIDARYTDYVDKEIIEFLNEFKTEQAPLRDISLNMIGFKDEYKVHNYIDFINVTTYDVQAMLTPRDVLNILKEGNQRFRGDTRIHRSLNSDIKHTATTQHPIGVVLGCIDSRVPVETVFDMSFGDLFCVRVAGNVVNNDVLASIEYACAVVGAKLIVILGHTRCGAIQAACDGVEQGHITQLLAKIQPAIQAEIKTQDDRTSKNATFIKHITELNIANTLQHIYKQSTILRQLIDEDKIGIVGAIYDVNSGEVHFKHFSTELMQLDETLGTALTNKLKPLVG